MGVKTLMQQATLTLHRQRELLMRMKIMQIDALRGQLYEFGTIFAQGKKGLLGELELALEALANSIPQYVADSLREQAQRIKQLSMDIEAIEVRLGNTIRHSGTSTRPASTLRSLGICVTSSPSKKIFPPPPGPRCCDI